MQGRKKRYAQLDARAGIIRHCDMVEEWIMCAKEVYVLPAYRDQGLPRILKHSMNDLQHVDLEAFASTVIA